MGTYFISPHLSAIVGYVGYNSPLSYKFRGRTQKTT